MKIVHKLTKPVKAYLLGSLSDQENSRIEARYFADPEFLKELGGIERELIVEYLTGRLSEGDRLRFEQKYLSVALLEKRVEEVRRELERQPRPKRFVSRFAYAMVLAGFLIVCIWVTVEYRPFGILSREKSSPERAQLRLAPGVTMAGESRMRDVDQPPAGEALQLQLEYPTSDATPPEARMRVSRVENDGTLKAVWESPSPVVPQKQDVGFVFQAAIDTLPAGDYIAELVDVQSRRIEAYVFRVRSARQ